MCSSKSGSLYELNVTITNALHEISVRRRDVFNELEYPCERCTLTMTVVEITLKFNNLKSKFSKNLVNDQLDAQFFYFIIPLLQSSTYFEQRRAHHQEVKFY